MNDPKCKDCRFWDGYGTGLGVCRRQPPVFRGLARSMADTQGEWPETDDTDWCGEFAPKQEQP